MPISKPHSTLGATNKDSCIDLAMYLEKENKDLDTLLSKTKQLEEIRNIESRKQLFFSHSKINISTNDVVYAIDNNKKKLSKTDAKYFAPTINFSQQELNHILTSVTEKPITDVWQLNQEEYQRYNLQLQEYIRLVMSNYAVNFNRKGKGLKTGEDLVYFAKIEHFRRYKGTDPEVVNGSKKTDGFKPGLNSHAHIIVSRKDKTQKLKLNPTTKEKSTDRVINGNKYHVGFDRMNWINMNESSFDSFFNYQRPEIEKFNNQYILKNGSPQEKKVLSNKIKQSLESKVILEKNVKNNINNTPKRRRG
ncbi:DUF5712 family protein [Olleya namhaensis]|uniref:DUF5712 family protein n=1 Tax=Olleya namhaensis TaxID=1144750 RepID=UPI00232AEE3D|nr:DUF5712 family protein [Olleya namhaensis]